MSKHCFKGRKIMQTKIKVFCTDNPTDRWVLVVDGYFGFFDSEKEVNEIYNQVGLIDNSPFGAMEIIPPHYRCEFWNGSRESHVVSVVDYTPINITNYIEKNINKVHLSNGVWQTAKERLLLANEFSKLFASESVIQDAKINWIKRRLP